MPRAFHGFRHQARDFYTSLRFNAGGGIAVATPPVFAAGSFTLAAWINLASVAAAQTVLASATAGAPSFTLNTSGQLVLAAVGGATAGTSLGAVGTRGWAHVAVSYNQTTGATRFFIDGEDAGASNTAVAFSAPAALTSALSAGSLICRLGIWAQALSQSDVRGEFYADRSPAAAMMLRCADAVGTTLADSAGSAVGTITSCTFAPWSVPTAPIMMPREGGSVLMASTTDYIACASGVNNVVFNGQPKVVLAAWIKTVADGVNVVASRTTTVHMNLAISAENISGNFRSRAGDVAQNAFADHKFASGKRVWKLVAAEADFAAGRSRQYLNGVCIGEASITGWGAQATDYSEAQNLRFGQDPNGTGGAAGYLGPVYMLGGSVTRQDLRDLYLTGKVPNVDRVAYWLMNDRSGSAVTQRGNVAQAFSATLAGSAAWSLEAPW